jgi:hypothetical protein
LGGWDKSEVTGPMIATRIAGSFHWEVKLDGISVNNYTFRPSKQVGLTDTGTTHLIMPYEDWNKVFNAVCGQLGKNCDREAYIIEDCSKE